MTESTVDQTRKILGNLASKGDALKDKRNMVLTAVSEEASRVMHDYDLALARLKELESLTKDLESDAGTANTATTMDELDDILSRYSDEPPESSEPVIGTTPETEPVVSDTADTDDKPGGWARLLRRMNQ